MGLLLELDFGNSDALENADVNVDMPRCPGMLDEETLFLQNIVSTDGREHPLSASSAKLLTPDDARRIFASPSATGSRGHP